MDKPTEKQLVYIQEIQEYSYYPIPVFQGTTKQEASKYINKYSQLAHENIWAIINGY